MIDLLCNYHITRSDRTEFKTKIKVSTECLSGEVEKQILLHY